ncbi:ABC transporter ATP-binding protein [Paraburkholderia sp. SIMBA_049]
MITIRGLNAGYGGLDALVDVSMEVEEGQLVTVAGPNGAGKSTLFKVLSGVVPARTGRIEFDGINLLEMKPSDRAGLGIAHVPEGWQVFKSMTVLENLEMGALARHDRKGWKRDLERIYELFPILAERRSQLAGTLSGGQQQMVAIGRGLASAPRLLLLDEPSMGLAPALIDTVFERIGRIHAETALTIMLVEQRATEALELCSYGYVLESGRVVAEGSRGELLKNPRVQAAYLGI